MRVVVVGASGTIGSKVVEMLQPKHEVVKVGRTRGDVTVDIADSQSIQQMYTAIGEFDSLVAAAGGRDTHFGPFEQLGEQEFYVGIKNKMMGQINLVLIGRDFINDGGSFTLSTGYLSHYPNPTSCATGPINAAVDTFATSASIVMPRGIRINSVSPAPVVDGPVASGSGQVSVEEVAKAYVESVEGDFTGQVLRVWNVEE